MKAEYLIITALCCLALFSCKKGDGAQGVADRVLLSAETVNLKVDESAVVTARVFPESLGMGVTWEVMDTAIVSCDNGLVKGKALGVTYLVATSADGLAKSSCMVSVNPDVKYSVSIIDENGNPLPAVYGYPGQKLPLAAYTSDGESHTFTWTVDDTDVAEVTDDGIVTMKAVKSVGSDYYVYDAQTFISVTTEEDFGCRIPLRSNLVNGIVFGEDVLFYPAGTTVMVEASKSYPLAFLYTGAEDQLTDIPAGGINYSISDPVNFAIVATGNDLALNTGKAEGVSATLTVIPDGTDQGVEIAQFEIEKGYDIKASLYSRSSGTLVFTWTEGVSADDDGSHPYNISLYKDKQCTELLRSYNPEGCWSSKQPRFAICRLTPGTTYYCKVLDTTPGAEKESNVVEAATEEFTIVEMPELITSGGVVLAENFNELGWYDDLVSAAAGVNTPANVDDGTFSVEGVGYVSYHKSGEPVLFTHSVPLATSRLDKWANGKSNQCYVHAGMIKFGTASAKNYLFTPEFPIAAGKTAKVSVTVEAAPYAENETKTLAFGVVNVTPMSGTHRVDKFSLPSTSSTDKYAEGSLSSKIEWKTVTVSGLTVAPGERIVIGPTDAAAAKSRYVVRKVVVEVTEIK